MNHGGQPHRLEPNTKTAGELAEYGVDAHFKVLDECCRCMC